MYSWTFGDYNTAGNVFPLRISAFAKRHTGKNQYIQSVVNEYIFKYVYKTCIYIFKETFLGLLKHANKLAFSSS